jgi:hypothetical protein
MTLFSSNDARLIRALEYDRRAVAGFEVIKTCLIWSDETPSDMSNEGRALLGDVLGARGMLHRGIAVHEMPSTFAQAWMDFQRDFPGWPGFRRTVLSPEERAYLTTELRRLEDDEVL